MSQNFPLADILSEKKDDVKTPYDFLLLFTAWFLTLNNCEFVDDKNKNCVHDWQKFKQRLAQVRHVSTECHGTYFRIFFESEDPRIESACVDIQYFEHVNVHERKIVNPMKLVKSYRKATEGVFPSTKIDLVDKACASTRVQLDSQPGIIDKLERRELQLDVEATALSQEKDEASKQRLKQIAETGHIKEKKSI